MRHDENSLARTRFRSQIARMTVGEADPKKFNLVH